MTVSPDTVWEAGTEGWMERTGSLTKSVCWANHKNIFQGVLQES
jgi:hypothetical protein